MFEKLSLGFCCVLALFLIYLVVKDASDCIDRGGEYVRTLYGSYKCVDGREK